MICPHCNKPIRYVKSEALKKEALALIDQGYSSRDVEQMLGRKASYVTIARWAKARKDPK